MALDEIVKTIKAKDVIRGVFESYAPFTMSSANSVSESVKDTVRIGKQIKTGMRQNLKNIDQSMPGRKAIALLQAAQDALRNGTYELDEIDEAMYEDYAEYEDNFTTESMTEEEREALSPEEVILRGNRGVAQSVIRASTAQLQGMGRISGRMLRGTLQGMEASTKSINATILYGSNMLSAQVGSVGSKLDVINENLVNLIEYQNNNTTLFYEKNLELMDSMINSVANFEKMNRGSNARDLKNFNLRSGFNVKDYIERVKKGVKGSTLITGIDTLGSLTKMSIENPEIMSLGQTIGSFIPSILGMLNIGTKTFNKLQDFDKSMQSYSEELMYKIGDKLSTNIVASFLGLDSLGNKRRTIDSIQTSMYMKEQIPWNGKAQKALTEVIPELLTSIDAGVNNTEKRYYDYEFGNWKSRKELEESLNDNVSNLITLGMNDAAQKLNHRFENSGLTDDEIANIKKQISDVSVDLVYDKYNRSENYQKLETILENAGLSMYEVSGAMNSLISSTNEITENIADLYAQIGTTDSVFRNITNLSGRDSKNAVGKKYEYVVKARRHENDIFSMTFKRDAQMTVDYIDRMMREQDPNFIMTKEIKEGILVGIRQGLSDEEILRQTKNTVGKGTLTSELSELPRKIWAKFTNKQYVPNPTAKEDLNYVSYGKYGDAANIRALEKVYGIKTGFTAEERKPSEPPPGAASSRATEESGVSAGAGTNGKSSVYNVPSSGNTTGDSNLGASINALTERAGQSFDQVMNDSASDLDRVDQINATAADALNEVANNKGKTFGGSLKNLIDAAVVSMGSMVTSFTSFSSRLFGKEGMIKTFFESDSFKNTVTNIKNWILYDDEGNLKESFQTIKNEGAKIWDDTETVLASGYNYVYDNYSKYRYGEDYKENEQWQNSSFMQSLNLKDKRIAKRDQAAEELGLTLSTDAFKDLGFYKDTEGHYYMYSNGAFIDANGNKVTPKSKTSKESSVEVKTPTEEVTKTSVGKSSIEAIPQDNVEEIKGSVEKVSKDTPEILKSSVQQIAETSTEVSEKLKTSTDAFTETIVGTETPDQMKKTFADSYNKTIRSALPKIGAGAILGAGVGFLNGVGGHSLLGSLFLPTGLFGGAIVGGGLTLLSQTEAFKSLMFGKIGEDGERSGGLISKELKEKFKKAAPVAVGGAVAGALKSVITAPFGGGNGLGVLGMQLLPGGILGGAITGMGIGLLKNSETFKSMLFGKKGEDGTRTGTWLSKSFNSIKEKMTGEHPGLKKMLKGAGLGVVTGAVMESMGAIPAALSVGGPIGMGIAGLGLGIASSTKHFNSWLFGTEEFDDNGKSLGRKGGILEQVKNILNLNVIEPITFAFKSAMFDMVDWAKEKITFPFRKAFDPILDSIMGIKDNVTEFIADKFEAIGDGIKTMFEKTIHTLFSPITKLIGKVGSAIIGGAKVGIQAAFMPLTAGLNALNILTMGKRKDDYKKFYKNWRKEGGMQEALQGYWDAKNADYQAEADDYNSDPNHKFKKSAKKVGFFEKASDYLTAMTGQGEVAEAARSGWNAGMTEEGKNHLDWRDVGKEAMQLKADRRERHKAERTWAGIHKLSQNIGTKDLKGRRVELTDARFKYYKDKFIKKGIDGDLIQTNEDLMDLIYTPEKFRKKAAGDSGQNGMLQALKDFKLPPEELEAMKRTEEFQDTTTKFLSSISDNFAYLAEQSLFDRSVSSYNEDRKHDMKKLKKNAKSLYKSEIWGDNAKIDFKDPDLYEYDISNLSKDSLQDYALSEYAKSGDFVGWLNASGRKIGEDDYRRKFIDPKYGHEEYIDRKTPKTFDQPIEEPQDQEYQRTSYSDNTNASLANDTTESTPTAYQSVGESYTELIEAVKEQTNIAKTEAEINAGGSKNFLKLRKKAQNGRIDAKTANKQGFSGFFGNLFNRKKKDEEDAAAKLKEEQESAEAQALGDSTDNTTTREDSTTEDKSTKVTNTVKSGISSVFGGILGGVGSLFGKFFNTKVGKVIKSFGLLTIPATLGLTVLELIKPGSADSIGASITNWNNKMKNIEEGGTLLDQFSSAVMGWFNKAGTWINEKVLSKDGYLVKGITAITSALPNVFEKVVLPGFLKVTDFVIDNASTLVGAVGDVVLAIAPPLASAVVEVMPQIIGSVVKTLWNKFTGKESEESGSTMLTDDEANTQISSGKRVEEKWDTVTEEDAESLIEQGYEVRQNSSGKWQVKNKYTLDSNNYIDTSGNVQTAKNTSQLDRIANVGTQIGRHFFFGSKGTAAKLTGTALTAALGTTGGTLGLFGSPLLGFGTVATGAKVGSKAGTGITNTIKKLFGKGSKEAVEEAAENATVKAASKAVENAAENATVKTASKAVENTVTEVAEDMVKAAATTAGSGIEAVGESVIKENQGILKQCADAIGDLADNEAINKVIKESAESGTETAVKRGFKTVLKEIAEKLGTAMIEVGKKSKLGNKIITLIAGKEAVAGTKSALAVGTAGLVEIGSITVGAIFGVADTGKIANLFEVSKSAVNWKMRLISSLLSAISSSTIGGFIDIGLAVVELILGVDIKKWLAASMYDAISGEIGEAQLDAGQEQLAIETELYNAKYGTNMTVSEYNDAANKGVFRSIWGAITGTNIDNKDIRKEAEQIMQSRKADTTTTKSTTASASNYLTGNTSASASVTSYNGNNIGYGPGQSQANAAWADMPIGRFANGEVSTMRTGGCGPTALSTIANMYGPGITPGTVGAYAANNGYISSGGANAELFTKGAAGLGLNGTKVGKNDVQSSLEAGKPMAISGKDSGPFTKNGHVVVANGISGNKIRIIDPSDGQTKVYNKSDITSGMTNAWAYDKPKVGYGNGPVGYDNTSSDTETTMSASVLSSMGITQTALSSIPTILQNTLPNLMSTAVMMAISPISAPIEAAVDAITVAGKVINKEPMTQSEITELLDPNTALNKLSSVISSSMKSTGTTAKAVSSATKLQENVATTTKSESILTKAKNAIKNGLATLFNKTTTKSVGNGPGPVGYAALDKSASTMLYEGSSNKYAADYDSIDLADASGTKSTVSLSDLLKAKQSKTTTKANTTVNNNYLTGDSTSTAMPYNGITADDLKRKTIITLDDINDLTSWVNLSVSEARSLGNQTTTSLYDDVTNRLNTTDDVTLTKQYNSIGSAPYSAETAASIAYQYNTQIQGKEAEEAAQNAIDTVTLKMPEETIANSSISDILNTTSVDDTTESVDFITELKEALSKPISSLGDFLGGFSKIGNVLKALLGTIKGEGSFTELYTQYASGSTSSSTLDDTTTESSTDNSVVFTNGTGEWYDINENSDEEKAKIWKYFKRTGYNEQAIAAIMGGWSTESGNRSGIYEGYYLNSAKKLGTENIFASNASLDSYVKDVLFPAYEASNLSINKSGYTYKDHYYPGIGLAQWTGNRSAKLLETANENETDWRDLNLQLDYANDEMVNSYNMRSKLNKAESLDDATSIFVKNYEGNAIKLSSQQEAARNYYNKYSGTVGYGSGPIGYASDWSEFMAGADTATEYLKARLEQMGLKDYLLGSDTTTTDTNTSTEDVTMSSSVGSYSKGYAGPVNAMASILGKLHYSLGSVQDPDQGVASCASTVAWAYDKALGIRPGDTVSSTAYMGSTSQAKDSRFKTVWTNDGSGLTNDDIENVLKPGDILYQNWDQTKNTGKMQHTEMYVGDGKTLSHGGPKYNDMGPVYKDLGNYRKIHTMMVRRLKDGVVGYGEGEDDSKKLKLENNFTREMAKSAPKVKPNPEGEGDGDSTEFNDQNIVDRLDKIVTVIGEWYMMSKQSTPESSSDSITNNTIVNNSTVNNSTQKTTTEKKQINSNINKLMQKQQAFSRMYKS